MKAASALAVLTVVFCTLPVLGQESTREDFKEWCSAFEGRWIGEVTWVADWPGLGKRCDKVTAYLDVTTIEEGNGLVFKFYGGNGSGTMLYTYDPAGKQIKGMSVFSGGFAGSTRSYKKEGKWVEEGKGSLPDGKITEGTSHFTFSDGGKTLTITGTGTVDGKKHDDQHDVWRRVSK